MTEKRTCPQCGAERTDDSLSGLCPRCLARFSFFEWGGDAGIAAPPEEPGEIFKLKPESDLEFKCTGLMIGRYKLLQQIGEGGFGVVYMAEQVEPVRRKVALKIIKAGMDTRRVVARFEAERQALALMDHPNIAQVFDGGVTQAGRPYFVMELVRGIPITQFCDQRHLDTEARLHLFIQVCKAVQHAHQKGIIHRDLKPSNILVTLRDADRSGVPKVIDFGVAKALNQRLTNKTLFTGFLHMVGTPAYMSPEQAELSGQDIDTRSDIYSLGVLLYELLTGVTPFDAETLRNAALDEVRRMIREAEPPKPSTRLQTLGHKLTDVAKHRHIDAPKLIHLLRGDLDWIVMQCLDKNRRRRYDTASGLANDLQRHLQNETVTAAAPSSFYRFQKFARRNKLALIIAGVIAALLLAGVAVSTMEAVRATRAERVQRRLREQAEKERERATTAEIEQTRLRQEAEARRVAAVADGLARVGKWSGAIAPRREALALWKQAQGEESVDVAEALGKLVSTLATQRNQGEEAIRLCRELLAMQRRLFGDQNSNVVVTLSYLANLVRYKGGKLAEAESLYREAATTAQKLWGTDSRQVAIISSQLGDALYADRKYAEAEGMYRSVLAIEGKLPGNKRPDYNSSLDKLADVLYAENKISEAEAAARESLLTKRRLLGEGNDDASVARSLSTLATLLDRQGKLSEAEKCYRDELAIDRKIWANGNRNGSLRTLLRPLDRLMDVLCRERKYDEAEHVFADIVPPVLESRPDPKLAAALLRRRAEFFGARGRWRKAITDLNRAIELDPTLKSSCLPRITQWNAKLEE